MGAPLRLPGTKVHVWITGRDDGSPCLVVEDAGGVTELDVQP